jgi:hypothetical protein
MSSPSSRQRGRDRKFVDSPLEETGFEPSVPLKAYPGSFAEGAVGFRQSSAVPDSRAEEAGIRTRDPSGRRLPEPDGLLYERDHLLYRSGVELALAEGK